MIYDLVATVTISITCRIEADSAKEALEKSEDVGMQDFCWQCSTGDDDEWSAGELDGEPTEVEVTNAEEHECGKSDPAGCQTCGARE